MKLLCVRKTQYEDILKTHGIDTQINWLNRKNATNVEINAFTKTFYEFKPDVFYFYKDEQLSVGLLHKLKKMCNTKFVMFYGDQRGCVPPLIYERRDVLDLLLINNEDPKQFDMYKKAGIKNVKTFHHGAPINEFREFPIAPTFDVFFGGNNFNFSKFPLSKLRYDLILRIRKTFPNMVVYGNGWPFTTKRAVPRHQYARVLRSSKTNIGINHYDVLRYYDRRLFECMASGRVHITKYVPGMEKHFENYKHLVWFNSTKECLNAISNMLRYPQKREKIAAAGRDLIMKQHSFDIRALQFKDLLLSL